MTWLVHLHQTILDSKELTQEYNETYFMVIRILEREGLDKYNSNSNTLQYEVKWILYRLKGFG